MRSGDRDEFAKATEAHAAGKLAAAQELYESLLQTSPNDHLALLFLGVSHIQQGRPKEAIPHIERALALEPGYADAHFNLGCALQALNRLDEAIAHYDSALAIDPGYAGAQLNLGNALQQLGRHEEAIARYRQTLLLRPEDADAYNNWGNSLQALNRHDAAIARYARALALKPGHAEAHNNLGNSLLALGRHGEAIACYERALAFRPGYAEARNNLGYVLQKLNRFEQALACFGQVLAIEPGFAAAYNNWGITLQALNLHEEAIKRYENAIALKPDYAEAQWNKGFALLRLGRYREGWPLYEKRWQLPGVAAIPGFDRPLWRGREGRANAARGQPGRGGAAEALQEAPRRRGMSLLKAFLNSLFERGRDGVRTNLLVQFEQGLGDAIQMLRYVALLEQMGVQCWIQAPPELSALAQRSFPASRLVPVGQCPAQVEFRIPLMSLPLALDTFAESDIPRAVPYLIADAEKKTAWAARLATRGARTVGLAWRGKPTHTNDRNRSIPLEALASLFSRRDIQFVTLQKDLTETESGKLACYENVTMLDRELASFDDTAAVVSILDLMISVDSAPAHLSGALGKATWVLLPFSPDWRWLLARSDSPWYPSARLFRQRSPGDWTGVIHDIGATLSQTSWS